MSEIVEGQEPENTPTNEEPVDQPVEAPEDGGINDLEAALAEISKLRKENASKRVKSKEKDAELEEFRKWKDSQKTELEKLQEAKASMEEELRLLRSSKKKNDVAEAVELPIEWAKFIQGDDEDEMKESAKELKKMLSGRPATTPSDLGAGRRGTYVGGSNTKSAGATFLDELIEESKLSR